LEPRRIKGKIYPYILNYEWGNKWEKPDFKYLLKKDWEESNHIQISLNCWKCKFPRFALSPFIFSNNEARLKRNIPAPISLRPVKIPTRNILETI